MPELIPTPKWITDTYDPSNIKPHYAVEVTKDGFLLKEIDLTSFNPYTFPMWELEKRSKLTGNTIEVNGSLVHLYEWSRENNARPIGTPGSAFAEVLSADPNYKVPMAFGMPSSALMDYFTIGNDYKDFLKIVEEYEAAPTNQIVAFKFIDNHPMYWHFQKDKPRRVLRRRNGKVDDIGTTTLPETVSLITGRGWARVDLEIIQGKFSLETSGTPFHTQTNYHDYALDTYADSMDEAIIKLAAKIHEFYDLEGNLRSGADEPN